MEVISTPHSYDYFHIITFRPVRKLWDSSDESENDPCDADTSDVDEQESSPPQAKRSAIIPSLTTSVAAGAFVPPPRISISRIDNEVSRLPSHGKNIGPCKYKHYNPALQLYNVTSLIFLLLKSGEANV